MATTERVRQDRARRTPRNAQEAKDRSYYYRKEYGWMMSDEDVANERRVKAEYDANVERIRGQIANAEAEYAAAREKGLSDIGSQYSDAYSTIGANSAQVRVIGGNNNVEATYTVPKSYANEFANSGDLFTSWHGNYLNVGVKARGGRTVGQELHDALSDAHGQYSQAINAHQSNVKTQHSASQDIFNKNADAQLSGIRKEWDAKLAEAEKAYSKRVAAGAESYQKSRKAYNDSIKNMNLGLLETPTNQVNTGGSNG